MKKLEKMDIILLSIFIILIIVIIFLGIRIYHQKQSSNIYTDVVYIFEKDSKKKLNLDLTKLENKEYILKVLNYNDKKIIPNKIKYAIEIKNTTAGKMKITKNKNKPITIATEEAYILESNILQANKKTEDTYYIEIIELPKNSKKQKIEININS